MTFSSGAMAVLPAIPSLVMPATVETEAVVQPFPREVRSEDYQPLTDSKNVERFVNDYFADIPIMSEIAKCESQYRHLNSNGTVVKGIKDRRDTGVMQINLFYHAKNLEKLGLDASNIDDNVAYARSLYEKQGAKPWIKSSACWAKFDKSEIAKR